MHPQFGIELIHEETRRLDAEVRRAYRLRPAPARVVAEPVVLRLCTVHDDAALERLAQLEYRRVDPGQYVLAEIGGTVVAAMPVLGGDTLADPFRRTAHLLPLLRLRVKQLDPQPRPGLETAKAIAARMLQAAR